MKQKARNGVIADNIGFWDDITVKTNDVEEAYEVVAQWVEGESEFYVFVAFFRDVYENKMSYA